MATSTKITYKVLLHECVSKSGCRRISLGKNIASDPIGRVFVLSAFEKNKLAFIVKKALDEKNEAFV